MQPLRQECDEVRQTIECLLTTGKKKPGPGVTKRLNPAELRKASRSAESLLHQFLVRLQKYKLDEGPDARVLINADERTLFAQVAYVVDQVRITQIPKIYIETRIFQAK